MCFGCLFVFLFKYFCTIYNIYTGFYIYIYISLVLCFSYNLDIYIFYIYIPLSFADLCFFFVLFISCFVLLLICLK